MAAATLYRKILSIVLWFGMRNRRVRAVDVFCIILAVFVGYSMRFSYFLRAEDLTDFISTALFFTSVIISALLLGKTYTVVWTRASVEEYARLTSWYGLGVLMFVVINYFARMIIVPRSALLISSLLAIMFITGIRAMWRLAAVSRSPHFAVSQRALIVGAGEAGALMARDLLRNQSSMEPVGFIDDDPALNGMQVASLKVLGNKGNISDVIKNYVVDTVLIAIPSATGAQMREYIEILNKEKVTVRVLPSLLTLADGQVSVSRLRSVNLEDLLRREPIKLDDENIKSLISGKTVLVTGAGGSIGSEICRQVLSRGPSRLLALGHGEQSIYLLMESLAEAGNTIPVVPIIADIADEATMSAIFEKFSPQVVFHAGAHKHVPLMEDNPREALRVNAFGTWNIATLAGKHHVERFVMISTDKAVHPTSVMGATKRAAERLLLSVQQEYPGTKYMAVRFGNVLGSRGSVVPKFERQIAAGGPLTVTHPQMKRYFMLIPEAVSLVLQAGAMGEGGELFVLDMGEPVNISEMAETLIRLHGYEPHKDIQIQYTGIRPGEKLYEELFYDPGHVDLTSHAKIFKSKLIPEAACILPTVKLILNDAAQGQITGDELKTKILALGCEAGANNG